ncbi:Vacuolar protein sorting-associated protein 13 [Microbotryomycetes sp. JL221]|nr:Vacuolar protein sorting-associated protein 13 [Microbotryomycetes sp. JL221]
MLESVLAGVLNRFLSAYVDNLNTGQLNVGIWSGDVKLRNLRLKKEALDKFRLPVDVVEGYLGDLTLSNLGGKPVRVLIENVYLLATPTDSTKTTPEEDAARAQAAKLEKLENAELMTTTPTSGMSLEEEKKNQSFTTSLVNKIVDNLQLEIRNIHIRYEDKLSVPGHPFSVGLTLSHFSAISTDDQWKPAYVVNPVNGVHKLAKLESLAVYFDTDSESLAGNSIDDAIVQFTDLIARPGHTPKHQFILKPVSGQGRLIMNHGKIDQHHPKTDAELLFKELGFVLDADQYRDALSMVDLFHFYIRQREYRSFRPSQEEIDSNRNRALWKFAISAIRTEVHEKNRKWSWAYFEERRNDRKAYIDVFKAKSKNQISPEDVTKLNDLERKLSYKDIRFYRSIARSELRKERAAVEPQQKPAQKSGGGWLSWVGWGSKPAHHDESAEAGGALNDEQRKELYKAIDWDEKEAVANTVDMASDALMLRVNAKLETGSFALRSGGGGKDLLSLNFDGFQADVLQRPENFEATLALGGMRVFDGTSEGSVHKQIVRVKQINLKDEPKSAERKQLPPPEEREADEDFGQYDEPAEEEREDDKQDETSDSDGEHVEPEPFFWLKFEHKPLDERADDALSVKLRHMEIIYSRGYVEAVARFFKPPESQLESVGALIDVASSTLEGIRKETRAGLEYALAQHKTVDVHLDLNAPIIIVPESMTTKNCQHIVLDAGHISVESNLADQKVIDQVKAKENQEYKEEDYQRLESLMYDKFHIRLDDAQLLMGQSLQACLDALEAPDHGHGQGELHILERTSLVFLAQNCILNNAPNLTRFKVSGSLPSLNFNLSDRKYKSLMKMIDVALPNFDDNKKADPTTARVPAPVVRHTSFARSRTRAADDEEDTELHVHEETTDDGEEDGEDGEDTGKEKFYDTEDIADGKQNINQKTFEFAFQVDRVQTSIFRSHNDPSQPDRLLATAVLEGFRFEFGLRPYDMSVDVWLRSLYVEDKMVENDTDFRHLITSELGGGHEQDLVRVRYQGVQKTSPEFMTVHEGIDKLVDVEFSTLNIVVTRGSILTLFDWVMTTFTDPNAGTPPSTPDERSQDGQEMIPTDPTMDKMRIKVKLTSINLILNEDGLRLATLSLSAGDVSLLLRGPTMRMHARLGNLSLTDDFSGDEPQEMLAIQGDEVADLQYETYDPNDQVTYPGHDTLVHLRSNSFKFTFSDEPVNRILVFFSKFARMKAVYDAAAQAASQRASDMQTALPKMHYDIVIKTPIVVFPRSDVVSSEDVIVANLGEISLFNEFEVSADQVVTKIKFGLSHVRLTSTIQYDGEKHSLQMLDDVRFDVDVTSTQMVDPAKDLDKPATLVAAKMSDVKMNLTQAQYGFILKLLQTIPKAFATGDEDDIDSESLSIQPPRAIEAPTPSKDKQSNGRSIPATIDEEQEATVDLLPELSTVAKKPDGTTVTLKSTMEAVFSTGTIYLELFTIDARSVETLEDASLARFSLNDTGVKYKMMSNGSMEAEVAIKSFTIHDTRPSRLTKFREIIPATKHSGHQFMISYSTSGGKDNSSFANVTIDTPKIVFSLDPLFALLDYFTSAFGNDGSQQQDSPASDNRDKEADEYEADDDEGLVTEQPEPSKFAYRVNVVSPTVILLANPEKTDSEAVILSISQVQMAQQGTLALTVGKVGMFLCKMDKPKETLRVLDDFDITLSMDSRADSGRQQTDIDISVQALILRVSYRDIMLINSILTRAIELSNRAPDPSALPDASDTPVKRPPAGPNAGGASSSRKVSKSRPQLEQSRKSSLSRRRSSSVAALKAQVIVTQERLRASVDGFQLVLIGDLHDMPILDIKAGKFTAKARDWSADLDASVTITPFINYFNLRVSHWEPLMDPWEFSINVSKSITTGLLAISLSSRKRLELNVTATFIELALTTMAIAEREGDKMYTKPRGSNAPFLIKNRTGYPMSLWNETSNALGEASRLDDGQNKPWRFDDWRTVRDNISVTSHNSLTVLFEGTSWDRLKHVFVDREGEHIYALKPKLEKVTHRLLCEVKLVENVKVVTFRSTFLVENKSHVNAEMVIIDEHGKKASQIYRIPPGGDCAVPILSAYHHRIKLRPDPGFGYTWSGESLGWQDLIKRPTRAVVCRSQQEASFRFQAYAVHDKADPLIRIYPKITLRLRAPVEIQNLLPHDIRYRVFDKNLEHNWTSFLRAGGVSPIHIAELSHLLLLSVEVQDSVFQRSEFAIINTDNPEDLPVESDLVMTDKDGLKLNLRIHYQKHPESGGAFRVQVYSPYILINKTGCDFALKTKTFMSSAKNVAGQEVFSGKRYICELTFCSVNAAAHKRKEPVPFMFSFPTDDRRNRVLLRINDSNWSIPLSFETIGMETEVVLPSASGDSQIHIGLKVTEGLGDYKLTKVITLYPRFIVKNNLGQDIRVREVGSTDEKLLANGDRHFLQFMRTGIEPQLVLAYPGSPSQWSAPFRIQDIGQNYVRVWNKEEERLVRVDAVLEGPTIFVRLDEEKGSWPFLLRNDSDYPITFSQDMPEGTPAEARKRRKQYKLAPQSKLSYAWDLPAENNKQLLIELGGKERVINVLEIGAQVPFRFPNAGHTRVLSIDVRAEGPTQAVRFSNYDEEESVFKLQRRGSETLSQKDSIASSRDGVFEAVDVDVKTTFSFGINLEGVGISIVNKRMQELVYASFRGLTAKYMDSTTNVSYDVSCKWIQVDNQLFGGLYPILLYPSVIPKDGKELEVHPSLQASVIILKDDSHGVTYFKYASVLLQEMTIEVDEDFLFALLDFAKFSGATGQAELPSKLTDEPNEIQEPSGTSKGGDVYFEVLHLQPIQLDLSFMRTDRVNVDQKLNTRNPFFFFINALTMALGNVNDAPVRLNALVIENVRLSMPILQERLMLHYSNEFFGQLYRVLGSADFLGNPVGLFSNVSSGVADFFVQPYDSVMMNGNKDLGIGIARGAGSLAKKTVFGLSDSMAKVTGSIGKGLSAATLDKQYQSQRRMRQFRNKPKHALYGVTAGATSLVTSIASGVEGLATKPIEGAESGGAAGFLKGVGKGLVGVVTKPAVGFFDLANNITEGIRNTTTVFDQSSIDRVRLPRFTASDGILRPYSEREALGQNWLKNVENGKFFNETYVAHLDIPSSDDSLVVILTTTRILLVRVVKLKVGWDVPLTDLQTISLESTGITLVLRGGLAGPFLAIPDQSARLWLFRHLERIVTAHNSRRLAE